MVQEVPGAETVHEQEGAVLLVGGVDIRAHESCQLLFHVEDWAGNRAKLQY